MIQNPILQGFCPDPSIVRVGDDYYIVTSTFEWWPGVRVFHSKDLKHFEQLPSPLSRVSQLNMAGNPDSCGVWAPDLSYDGERFWLVFTDVKTRNSSRYYNTHNYVIWTTDIYGEWSEPVYLNSTGFDPSLFHNDAGKTYLVTMVNGFLGIQIQELNKDTMTLIGDAKIVTKGSGRGFTEGPHLYYRNGWYYLMMAEGGTSYEHCETMCRSRSLWGPYEMDPENPVLTSDIGATDALQKCGHADLVETQYGEWYMVHLCARPNRRGKCILGRETAIQKVEWTAKGWLRLADGRCFGRSRTEEAKNIKETIYPSPLTRDEFEGDRLSLVYNTLRIPVDSFATLQERKGWLRLYGKEFLNSCFQVALVARRQTDKCSIMQTCMEFTPGNARQAAGVVYMYDTRNFYMCVKTCTIENKPVMELLESRDGNVTTLAQKEFYTEEEKFPVYFRIETDKMGEEVSFFYRLEGKEAVELGKANTDILSDEHCVGFTGAHFGVYCHDCDRQKCHADFRFFELREAQGIMEEQRCRN